MSYHAVGIGGGARPKLNQKREKIIIKIEINGQDEEIKKRKKKEKTKDTPPLRGHDSCLILPVAYTVHNPGATV